eukprot:2039076-Pyramimonas_sp.AAC.2
MGHCAVQHWAQSLRFVGGSAADLARTFRCAASRAAPEIARLTGACPGVRECAGRLLFRSSNE